MSRKICVLLVILMVTFLFVGCEKSNSVPDVADETEKLESVTPETSEIEQVVYTDIEIVNRENHPTYYGSVTNAHETWADIEKGKILYGNSLYEKYTDSTIISLDSYESEDIIRSLGIYFSNFEFPVEISIDDALLIASSYMPFDVIEQYYEYKNSYMIEPDEESGEESSYYIISYTLTESGRSAYEKREHTYSGSIDV